MNTYSPSSFGPHFTWKTLNLLPFKYMCISFLQGLLFMSRICPLRANFFLDEYSQCEMERQRWVGEILPDKGCLLHFKINGFANSTDRGDVTHNMLWTLNFEFPLWYFWMNVLKFLEVNFAACSLDALRLTLKCQAKIAADDNFFFFTFIFLRK